MLVAQASAQDAPPPTTREPAATVDAPISAAARIRITADQELADLLELCARLSGTPIEYAAAEVNGPVAVRAEGELTLDALFELANRALASRNLTMVAMPGSRSLSVVQIAQAPSLARLEEGSLVHVRAGFVRVLVELNHDRTDVVKDAITLVLSKGGVVTPFKDTKSLLVSDLVANVRQAMRVARQIDGAYEELNVEEVALRNTTPTTLVALVERITNARKAVFGDKGKGTLLALPENRSVLILAPGIELDVWRDLVSRFDRAEPVVTRNYSPRRFALAETGKLIEAVVHTGTRVDGDDPWRLVVDPLTGSLVINASMSQHTEVEKLLDRMERVAEASQRPIRSFPVRNRSVEELVGLLQGLLDKGALQGATSAADVKAPDPTTQGVTAPLTKQPLTPIRTDKLGPEVVLTADKDTNRLIALGDPRVLEQLEALIKELDVRHPQVLVEAIVVSLTDDEQRSLGVEIQKLGFENDVQYRLTSLFGLGSPNAAESTLPAPGGAGGSGVVLDPGNFSAAVRALEVVNKGRTLTVPKVLVSNHQTATLNSVLQTPYASTNASTTVATTSFGGTLDAGTQISVTPTIAEGDQLLLDYTIAISSFVGAAADPALPPPRQENRLKSMVTVPDGYAVVIGGLEVASEAKARSSVPILGDIPLLGALFSNQSKTDNKSRFFVFLRCTVQRSQTYEDLRYFGEKDMAKAGVDDGWPKLEPRWIR